jgi:hypothetical protein
MQPLALAHHLPAVAGGGRSLTDMQNAFVVAFTSDSTARGNATVAARLAGYAETSARDLGRRLVGLPHIQDAIRASNLQQISGALASKAVGLLEKVLDDEEAPLKLRVEAAKTILDRAGYAASPTAPKSLSDKSLAVMTASELRETMRLAKIEMDRARVINQPPAVAEPQAAFVEAVAVDATSDDTEGTRQ